MLYLFGDQIAAIIISIQKLRNVHHMPWRNGDSEEVAVRTLFPRALSQVVVATTECLPYV